MNNKLRHAIYVRVTKCGSKMAIFGMT